MAQAGLHAILGIAVTRPLGDRSWSRAGIVIGSMLPDLDILVVVIAKIAGTETAEEIFHRTYSHTPIAVFLTALTFWLLSRWLRRPCWAKFGVGLAVGMGMHIGLDVLLWFRSVHMMWPIGEVKLWDGSPAWWSPWGTAFELPLEFGWFFLLFLTLLFTRAGRQDPQFRRKLCWWAAAQYALFVVFSVIALLTMPSSKFLKYTYVIPYLVSLVAACILSFKAFAPRTVDSQARRT